MDREEKAREYFRQGYNCCQSVAMAFSDITGLEPRKVAELTSGFGGGMGRMREVCGAVSGMTFCAGAIKPAADPQVREERTANYALVQEMAGEFREAFGSIVCKELLNLRAQDKTAGASGQEMYGPQPSERTAAFYHSRSCENFVGMAARIVAQKLENNTEN